MLSVSNILAFGVWVISGQNDSVHALAHPIFNSPSRFVLRCNTDGFTDNTEKQDKFSINGKIETDQMYVVMSKFGESQRSTLLYTPATKKSVAYVQNRRYAAMLSGDQSKIWRLTAISWHDHPNPSYDVMRELTETSKLFDTHPLLISGLHLDGRQIGPEEIKTLSKLTIEPERTQVTADRIQLDFSFDSAAIRIGRNLRCRCLAVFDTAADIPLVSQTTTIAVPGLQNRVEVRHRCVKVDPDTYKIETSYSGRSRSDPPFNGVQEGLYEYTCTRVVRIGPVPESEFTLESLGTSEPPTAELPPSRLYLWLALAGVLALTVAALVRVRNRKRRSA